MSIWHACALKFPKLRSHLDRQTCSEGRHMLALQRHHHHCCSNDIDQNKSYRRNGTSLCVSSRLARPKIKCATPISTLPGTKPCRSRASATNWESETPNDTLFYRFAVDFVVAQCVDIIYAVYYTGEVHPREWSRKGDACGWICRKGWKAGASQTLIAHPPVTNSDLDLYAT